MGPNRCAKMYLSTEKNNYNQFNTTAKNYDLEKSNEHWRVYF